MTDRCRDCSAPIVWCVTEAGKRMPVDAKPVRKVMVLTRDPANPGGPPLAKFVGQYASHFAHCPAAAARRGTGRQSNTAEQASTEEEKTDA